MAKARKSKAKKSKAKKSKTVKAKKSKSSTRRAAASSRGRTKKSKATKSKKAARKTAPKAKARKAQPKKKKQIVGEGDYQASRSFLKDQADFVKRNASGIPGMGKDAEAALEGPKGGELRAAEEEARSHSKASGE